MNKLVIAVDFDGTIVNNDYPKIGKLKRGAAKVINKLHSQGHYIIIWTCRDGRRMEEAAKFLVCNKIKFDQINNHHPLLIHRFRNNTRKISADIYIDDKNAGLVGINWKWLYWLVRFYAHFTKCLYSRREKTKLKWHFTVQNAILPGPVLSRKVTETERNSRSIVLPVTPTFTSTGATTICKIHSSTLGH